MFKKIWKLFHRKEKESVCAGSIVDDQISGPAMPFNITVDLSEFKKELTPFMSMCFSSRRLYDSSIETLQHFEGVLKEAEGEFWDTVHRIMGEELKGSWVFNAKTMLLTYKGIKKDPDFCEIEEEHGLLEAELQACFG